MKRARQIPGPSEHPLFGSLRELRVDALGYMRECARQAYVQFSILSPVTRLKCLMLLLTSVKRSDIA